MHRFFRFGIPFAVALAAPAAGQQQGRLTLETVLEQGGKLVAPTPSVLWQPGGHRASLVLGDVEGPRLLVRLDAEFAPTTPITAMRLLTAIGAGGIAADGRLPTCSWLPDNTLRIEHGDAVFHWRDCRGTAERVLQWPAGAAHAVAPDDAHVAWLDAGDLWLADRAGSLRRLTFDGSDDVVYGGAAHRAEFGITTGLFWSDDGRWLAFSREDQRPIAEYPYQDLGTRPLPRHGRYPMAGDADSMVTIGVCDTTSGAVTWLADDPDEDVYWTNVAVRADGAVFVARVNRGQDHCELVRYDAGTGERREVLLREFDREWIEPEHPPTFLPDGRLLWWSSRTGYRHLFALAADGGEPQRVTRGDFDVQRLVGVGDDALWFEASGEDPRDLHLFRAALDGSAVAQVTHRAGTHRAELSPDRRFAHVLWSDATHQPAGYFLDLATGEAVTPFGNTDDGQPNGAKGTPLGDYALPRQEFFTVEAGDGRTLYGHVLLPPDLQPGERRPALHYVYGGPHVQLVKNDWLGGAPLWLAALAAEGFVVCRLDNRGTPNRGVEFEQQIFRRLGTVEVDDQLRAVEWLKQQPYVDPDRIAVHGWSFGGYMTLRLLLLAPTTYACGISGAPVTDWSMYETGYTERYMDTPAENPKGYELSSCLPLAGALERPLLLVHGTDDRTVMWAHTLEFVDRCIAAGKTLTYFPYPMQQHGLRGEARKHFLRMLRDFLREHLAAPASPTTAANGR